MKRVLVLLAVLLAVSMSVGAMPAAAQTNASEDYTIEELRQDGQHYSVPSARIVPDEQRVYWLEHSPANKPWVQVTKQRNGQKFNGEMLRSNTLYLRTIRAQTDMEAATVKIVSWQPETRQVRRGNQTVEERIASNVTVQTQQVNLGPGWAVGEINLPRHDETTKVTMWIEGREDTARWTFEHKSVATTQEVGVDTWGDLLYKIALYVGLPVLFGGALVGRKVRSAVESAGIGPQWGFGRWLFIISLVTAILSYYLFTTLSDLIVTAPFIMGVWLVGVFAAYTLATHRGEIKTKGFLRPDIENAISFTNTRESSDGDLATDGGGNSYAHDVLQGEFKTAKTVEDEHGVSIVRGGMIPFLARVYGARARIENIASMTSRFELPSSSPDEIFLVDPEADTLVEYEPPGFEFDLPEWDRDELLVRGIGLVVAAVGVRQMAMAYGAFVYLLAVVVAAIAIAKWYIKPTDGFARIEPAPLHFRQAFASTLMLSHGLTDAKNLEEAKKRWRMEKLKTRREGQKELDEFDRAMMDHFAGEEVSAEHEDLEAAGQSPPGAVVPDGGDEDEDGGES